MSVYVCVCSTLPCVFSRRGTSTELIIRVGLCGVFTMYVKGWCQKTQINRTLCTKSLGFSFIKDTCKQVIEGQHCHVHGDCITVICSGEHKLPVVINIKKKWEETIALTEKAKKSNTDLKHRMERSIKNTLSQTFVVLFLSFSWTKE